MNKKISETKNIVEIIDKVYELNDTLQEALEEESNAIKSFSTDEKRTIKRKSPEGKDVPTEVSNKEIMEEIRVTKSLDGDAGSILKEVDQKTYDKLVNSAKRSIELHDYIQENLGFSFRHMGVVDYIKLTEAVIKYHNEKSKR